MSPNSLIRLSSLAATLITACAAVAAAQSTASPGEPARPANPCGATLIYPVPAEKVYGAVLSHSKAIEEMTEQNRKQLRIKWFKPKTETDMPSGLIVHRIVMCGGRGSIAFPASCEVISRTYWVRPLDSQRSLLAVTTRIYSWLALGRSGSHRQYQDRAWSDRHCEVPQLKLEASAATEAGRASQ